MNNMKPLRPFNEMWQKVTSAYLNNELKPYDCEACFIGNILGSSRWNNAVYSNPECPGFNEAVIFCRYPKKIQSSEKFINNFGFTSGEIARIEYTFLQKLMSVYYNCEVTGKQCYDTIRPCIPTEYERYEVALFEAMLAGLDELRKVYKEHGEPTDETLVLEKRVLAV